MLTMSVNKVYLLSYNAYESSGLFWRLMPDLKPLRKNFPCNPSKPKLWNVSDPYPGPLVHKLPGVPAQLLFCQLVLPINIILSYTNTHSYT